MKKTALIILALGAAFCLGFFCKAIISKESNNNTTTINPPNNLNNNNTKTKNETAMKLGAFSISLNVKDLTTSKAFYETLGFKTFAGGMEQKYLIMKNENALIGLFQGMFEGNLLTFNPGWNEDAKNIEQFDDVRVIQKQLKGKSIKLVTEADENTTGPASFLVNDPDGNVILIDQHR